MDGLNLKNAINGSIAKANAKKRSRAVAKKAKSVSVIAKGRLR